MGDWTFFSNYGHVLVCLAANNGTRLRDVAADVGITERAVQKIVHDLQAAGFVTVEKQGRRNRYRINKRKSLRHSLESHCTVGKLLGLVVRPEQEPQDEAAEAPVAKAAPAPEPEPKPAPAAKPEPAPDSEPPTPKPRKSRKPPETREQGTLF